MWEYNMFTNQFILLNGIKPVAGFRQKAITMTSSQLMNWIATATALETLNYGEA